jgi:hypothetical protein
MGEKLPARSRAIRVSIVQSRQAQISFFFLLVAALCWLGGINVRAMTGFDLLQIGTLDFKPNIHPIVERAIFGVIARSSLIVNVAYIVAWIAATVFLRTTNLRFKEEGWLAMSAILFYLFTPVEIYTMILDWKLWYLDFIGSNDLVEFRKLFIHRLAALAGVPMIALLSYYTIIGLAIFRPLRRRTTQSAPSV